MKEQFPENIGDKRTIIQEIQFPKFWSPELVHQWAKKETLEEFRIRE